MSELGKKINKDTRNSSYHSSKNDSNSKNQKNNLKKLDVPLKKAPNKMLEKAKINAIKDHRKIIFYNKRYL